MDNMKLEENKRLMDLLGADHMQTAALLELSYRFFEQGRLTEARKILMGLAVLDATNSHVFGMLGAIYQKEERLNVAIACYNKALYLSPADPNCLTNRGEVLLKLGRFEEAGQDLRTAIELDPGSENPAANRARLLVLLVQDAFSLVQQHGLQALQQERKRFSN